MVLSRHSTVKFIYSVLAAAFLVLAIAGDAYDVRPVLTPIVIAAGKGSKKKQPKMPAIPPPPDPEANEKAKEAAAQAKSRERRRASYGSMNKTLATSPEGVLGAAPTSAPTLSSKLG